MFSLELLRWFLPPSLPLRAEMISNTQFSFPQRQPGSYISQMNDTQPHTGRTFGCQLSGYALFLIAPTSSLTRKQGAPVLSKVNISCYFIWEALSAAFFLFLQTFPKFTLYFCLYTNMLVSKKEIFHRWTTCFVTTFWKDLCTCGVAWWCVLVTNA